MFNERSLASLFCVPSLLGSWAGIGSYAPSLDVYGSYFPAWLICLMAGVVLTIFVSLVGRVFDLGTVRILGPLVPIGLILIFSITTWFLFFAA
jgi:hypothetical protein